MSEAISPLGDKEKITPLGSRVLIHREPPVEKTEGGIVLVELTKTADHAAETRGTVVAVGSEAWTETEESEASRCYPGDKVIISKYSGADIDLKRYGNILVNDKDVIARIG